MAGDVLVPGEILRGAFALLNTDYNRYTRVTVSLVGTEYLHFQGRREEREVRRLSIEVDTSLPATRVVAANPVSAGVRQAE